MQIEDKIKAEKEKKKYLEKYTLNRARIRGLLMDLEFWESYASSTSQSLKPIMVSTSGSTGKMEQGAVNAVAVIEQITRSIAECEKERKEVYETIGMVHSPRYRTVLEMIFIDGMSIAQVAGEFGKSYQGMNNIYHKAMEQITIEGVRYDV